MKTSSLLCLLPCLLSCGNAANPQERFGEFGYNGIYLSTFSSSRISAAEAYALLPKSRRDINPRRAYVPMDSTVGSIMSRFGSLYASVSYYVEEEEEQQVRSEIFQGSDFQAILTRNVYVPFGQMSVEYLLIDSSILDHMEEDNAAFASSSSAVPFKEPYTYHRSAEGNLVVQTHRYAELSTSNGGGIGASFRQDAEMLYDGEGKMVKWQSSLGLFTSTPSGTSRQGYIFEAQLQWILK